MRTMKKTLITLMLASATLLAGCAKEETKINPALASLVSDIKEEKVTIHEEWEKDDEKGEHHKYLAEVVLKNKKNDSLGFTFIDEASHVVGSSTSIKRARTAFTYFPVHVYGSPQAERFENCIYGTTSVDDYVKHSDSANPSFEIPQKGFDFSFRGLDIDDLAKSNDHKFTGSYALKYGSFRKKRFIKDETGSYVEYFVSTSDQGFNDTFNLPTSAEKDLTFSYFNVAIKEIFDVCAVKGYDIYSKNQL